MKRIFIIFIITLMIFSINIYVRAESSVDNYVDEENINERNEKAAKLAVEQLLEPFKSENVPENERIISYRYSGFGVSDAGEEGNYSISAHFMVEPYSEENTIWEKGSINCFVEYRVVDHKIEILYNSLVPKKYNEFIKRFEEYEENNQENNQENVEVNVIKGDTREDLKNYQVEKMSNIIFIVCGLVLIITITCVIVKIVKNKKKIY